MPLALVKTSGIEPAFTVGGNGETGEAAEAFAGEALIGGGLLGIDGIA